MSGRTGDRKPCPSEDEDTGLRCGRERGHQPPHRHEVEWEDDAEPSGEVAPTERPGIVPGRLDPYVWADHVTSLNMARIADGMVHETRIYAVKHDELWALQLAAERASMALWKAIGDHPTHCHGCERRDT